MYQQDLLYTILLLVSALISLITLSFIWPKRTTPGAVPLLLLMAAMLEWSLTYALHWLVSDPAQKSFWLDATYFGAAVVPTCFLVFVLIYTEKGHWLNRQAVVLLAVEPALTILLLWTDPAHGLFFAGKRSQTTATFFDGGPWFWVNVVYSYALMVIGLVLLIREFLSARSLYRRQIHMLIIGALLPLGVNVISVAGLNPLTGLDLTPILFTITGVIFSFNLLKAHLLDIVPIARSVLIESMGDGVLVLDNQNRILDLNRAAQQIFDLPARDVIGQDFGDTFPQWLMITEYFHTPQVERAELVLEQPSRRYFDVQFTPLHNHDERTSGLLITLHDISHRKQAELEREQMIADLDAYAHTVAHDLKNPVHILLGYANLLLEPDFELDEEARPLVVEIRRTSQKLNTIISELLLLASIRKLTDIETHPLDMGQIHRETLGRLSNLVEFSGAEIVEPPVWPTALGYTPWVEEIWVNYLSNALKYGGAPPRIRLDAAVLPDGMVRFSVSDSGPGIAAEDQSKLFHKFERLGQIRAEGYGLGLSIVKRIAEKLGGEVGVESEVGKGATFYFTLPSPKQ